MKEALAAALLESEGAKAAVARAGVPAESMPVAKQQLKIVSSGVFLKVSERG